MFSFDFLKYLIFNYFSYLTIWKKTIENVKTDKFLTFLDKLIASLVFLYCDLIDIYENKCYLQRCKDFCFFTNVKIK